MRLAQRALIAALVTLMLCEAVSAQRPRPADDPRNHHRRPALVVQRVDQLVFSRFLMVQLYAAGSLRSVLLTAILIVIRVTPISLRSR